ncbi:zinc finger, CCHC-type containing protein [Tanacetum coccineum]
MTGTKFDIEKFDGKNDFALWQEITRKTIAAGFRKSFEILNIQSLANRCNLTAIDTAISDEDKALLLLLTSLPSSYDNSVQTLLYRRDTLKARRRAQGRSSRLRCYICQSEEHLKRDCPRYNHKKSQGFVRNEDQDLSLELMEYNVDVIMAMSVEEYEGGKILLGDGRECHIRGTGKVQIQMRDGSSSCWKTSVGQDQVNMKTLKGRKQLGEYQIGWKIKTGNRYSSRMGWLKGDELDTLGLRHPPSSAIRFKTPIDMLEFFGWLASIKQGMLEPVKVKCIFLGYRKGIVGNKALEVRVQYKVVQGVLSFKDLIYYHLTRDREQHSTHELFSYREDSNEAAFAVAAVDKIYAHESLLSNKTVLVKVISSLKAGLKDDMDARIRCYVLTKDARSGSDDSDFQLLVSYTSKESTWVMEIRQGSKVILSRGVTVQFTTGSCTDFVGGDTLYCCLDGVYQGAVMWKRMEWRKLRSYDAAHDGLSPTEAGYMNLTGVQGGYLAKGTRNIVRIRAKDSSGYCYRCLVKGYPWSKVSS